MNQRVTRVGHGALLDLRQVDVVCDRFEKAWLRESTLTWPSSWSMCHPR